MAGHGTTATRTVGDGVVTMVADDKRGDGRATEPRKENDAVDPETRTVQS